MPTGGRWRASGGGRASSGQHSGTGTDLPQFGGARLGYRRAVATGVETLALLRRVPVFETLGVEGLAKVAQLEFLTRDGTRTLAQGAMQFILAQPEIACVIHTVTSRAELEEWAGAADVPPLDQAELATVAELYSSGFGLTPASA